MTDRTGEAIELHDTDSGGIYTDEYVVRGHVDRSVFVAAIAAWLNEYRDEDGGDGVTDDEIGPVRHAYARWCFRGDDTGHSLQTYREPGRGRFRVSVAYPQSALDAEERVRLQGEADRVHLTEQYPGCEIIEANAYGRHYQLRVPGLKFPVTMTWYDCRSGRMTELRGWAHGDDAAAWETYYAPLRAARVAP